jgi:predicted lipid-binding transport protein (Tim44 family)
MEALLVPLLILVLAGVVVVLAARAVGRRRPRPPLDSAPQPIRNSAELARTAAARLDQEQHRRLYALIAQGQAMGAIKLYLEATGEGLRASRDAVGALAAHPQPYRPQPAPEQPAHDDEEDAPQRFPYRYRAIASKGDVTREISSNMLNDEIYGRIRTLARSGDAEAAAATLTRHSDISLKQAREFIALLED